MGQLAAESAREQPSLSSHKILRWHLMEAFSYVLQVLELGALYLMRASVRASACVGGLQN